MALQTARFYQRSGLLAVAGFISALTACVMGVAWATEADSGRIEIEQSGLGWIIMNLNRK